jgi:putative FmdB family regulatory protein
VPTYQYACTDSACGHRFETVQSVSDDPLTLCPLCEGRLRKVFSAVGVVFKGSGFYRTDSRSDSRGSSNGKSSSSSSTETSAAKSSSSSSTSSSGPASSSSSGTASSSSSSSKAAAG